MNRPTTITTQWVATAACAFIAVGSLAVSVVFVLDARHDDRQTEQETTDTGFLGCLRYNDTRLLFRSVIEDGYLPKQSTVDPSIVVAYNAIADPNVKKVLAGLGGSRGQAAITDPNSTLNVQRNKTGTRPCEQEYPNHSKGIDLSTTVTVPPPSLEQK